MLALWLSAWMSAGALVGGCGVTRGDDGIRHVRGVLLEVDAPSLTAVRSFDMRTEDGRRLTFRAGGDIGMTPGHMREHMVLGEAVGVTYREAGDELLVTNVDD